MDYRFQERRLTMSFGAYPEVSLAEARERQKAAREQLRTGQNPTDARRLNRQTAKLAKALTFGAIADELLAKLEREQKAEVTIYKRRWLLKDLAAPLADRPVAEITPLEVLAVLREVEAKGQLETARRLRASIGQVMRLAVWTARAPADPTASLRGVIAAPVTKHRPAITDKAGAARLVKAIKEYNRPVVRAAMLAMLYCFPRPGECRLAAWREIDLEGALWTIPAERAKMRREHRIPLSRQALEVFSDLKKRTCDSPEHLCFPGNRSPFQPISENTICVALRWMGFEREEMSAHGFRALASSLLHEESGFTSESIERALGHQDQNAVRRAYARGEHWNDRVHLAQWWGDYLDRL
jgi:integrase